MEIRKVIKTFRLEEDLVDYLEEKAKSEDRSVNNYVVRILKNDMEKHQKKDKKKNEE